MKITRALKQKMTVIGFQIAVGQLSTVEALADALRAILQEVEQQLHANQN